MVKEGVGNEKENTRNKKERDKRKMGEKRVGRGRKEGEWEKVVHIQCLRKTLLKAVSVNSVQTDQYSGLYTWY